MSDPRIVDNDPEILEWEKPLPPDACIAGHFHGIFSEPSSDHRRWVELRDNVDWPEHWCLRRIWVHYPPRSGKWFWAKYFDSAYGPIGSIVVAPRPVSPEESERGFCANRVYLKIGILKADGSLRVREEVLVWSIDGEWWWGDRLQVLRSQIEPALDVAMRDPLWYSNVLMPDQHTLGWPLHELDDSTPCADIDPDLIELLFWDYGGNIEDGELINDHVDMTSRIVRRRFD